MELINKDALVAEIERRKQTWQHQDQQYVNGGKDICDYLLGFLDTLEVKDVDLDIGLLKALIKDAKVNSSNGIPTYEEAAKSLDKYYECKKKQWIDKACNGLREHLVFEEENKWCTDLQDNPPSNKEKMINDFCKTMSHE